MTNTKAGQTITAVDQITDDLMYAITYTYLRHRDIGYQSERWEEETVTRRDANAEQARRAIEEGVYHINKYYGDAEVSKVVAVYKPTWEQVTMNGRYSCD